MTPLLIAFDIGGLSPPVALCSRLPASASEELGIKRFRSQKLFGERSISHSYSSAGLGQLNPTALENGAVGLVGGKTEHLNGTPHKSASGHLAFAWLPHAQNPVYQDLWLYTATNRTIAPRAMPRNGWFIPALTLMQCFSVVTYAQISQAAEIHVQIMDSRTHLPLKGRRVQITFSSQDGQFYDKAPSMVGHTGSDGVVAFEVNQPVAPNIAVFIWYAYVCSDTGGYSTGSILRDGVVASWHLTGNKKADKWCAADSQTPRPEVQPGKIIIFVHPMNRLVWSWYDMFS